MSKRNENTSGNVDPRRKLASVSILIEDARVKDMIGEYSRQVVMDTIRDVLSRFRSDIRSGDSPPGQDEIIDSVQSLLIGENAERLRHVVNASGIILHTGLGRAVLPKQAADAFAGLDRCCNMQIDLDTGKRGKRNYRTEYLLRKLTGAEAAMVVNNNAAATLLILSALCEGKEVIVSRGQMIEIGGSFRLPDCIHQSGAVMVEVGTTNKTHLRDYERALTENTGMLLRVNPSNYRIVGFSKAVPINDLVTLKKKQSLTVVDDLGCGALVSLAKYGLPEEPTVQESIAAGADLACFSGDKLIGGPQAGIIVGKKDLIARIKKHPLTRMLRVCKLTDLALEQSLKLFLDPETLTENHPTLRMLTIPPETLRTKAEKLKKRIARKKTSLDVRVTESESAVGGGSMPQAKIKTYALAIGSSAIAPDRLSRHLRKNEPPVISRIRNKEVLLDMRTLLDEEDEILFDALIKIDNTLKPEK